MPHLVAECYNYFHHSAVQVLSIFSCKMSLLLVTPVSSHMYSQLWLESLQLPLRLY